MRDGDMRCSCGAGCKTFGECLRARSIGYVGTFPTRSEGYGSGDRDKQKHTDRELAAYRDARAQGVQPAGTTMPKIEQAMEISDRAGKAFDASTGGFT